MSPWSKYGEITIVSIAVLYFANAVFENFDFVCSCPMVNCILSRLSYY